MGNLSGAFDSGWNAYDEPERSFDPLPEGVYTVAIVESDLKETKSGNGNKYISCKLEVLSNNGKGRTIWANFHLFNANQTAVEIARADWGALCRACKRKTVNDSSELHNFAFDVQVGLQKRKDNGEPQNYIKKYGERGSMQPTKTTDNAGNAAPWSESQSQPAKANGQKADY